MELQDASSQRSIAQIPLTIVGPYLDYCAGGGGKTLAMADHFSDKIHAYDASAKRLIPLEERAKRAGAKVQIMNRLALKREKFGLVFADVPCSGSGSWRRDPAGKWRLDAAALSSLLSLQYSIFNEALRLRRNNPNKDRQWLKEFEQCFFDLTRLAIPQNHFDNYQRFELLFDLP
ncbi:MAG: hypothetical protein EBY35_05610 [Rhodobacteraceae bacterium]|nr:hypothetical protein [Paracoccaceae bacterium]